MRTALKLGAMVAVLIFAVTGCSTGVSTGSPSAGGGSSEFQGAELARPYDMPRVTMTATNGEPFNMTTDTSRPITLVFFGYTHCPDVCPLTMSNLTSALAQLPAEGAEKVQVVVVTTDPARDDVGTLRTWLGQYDPEYVGLTGPMPSIKRAASGLGVGLTGRKRLPSGGYDVGHGAQVIAFTGDQAKLVWTQGTTVGEYVADLTALTDQAS